MANNRETGNGFEAELCGELSKYGFWCHRMTQSVQGQPFDVIAARNGKTYPIDCKVCDKDVFRLDRIEDNQKSAMTLWESTGNGAGWFAMRMRDGAVHMIPLNSLLNAKQMKKSLNLWDIVSIGIPFRRWVELCE